MNPLFWILLSGLSAPPVPATNLTATIQKRGFELVETIVERCDPTRLRAMLTPDFEMYHDKVGVGATSADQYVERYRGDCRARRKPDAWRFRRVLVESSLRVDPVSGYGAIEHGEHLFYERQGHGPERLSGKAEFTQLWNANGDGRQLARMLRFNHQPVKVEQR